jgi:hypothetical protein
MARERAGNRWGAAARWGAAGLGLALLAGCNATSVRDSVLSGRFGAAAGGPDGPKAEAAAYCPRVDVPEGGAAIRAQAGESVRYQIALGELARECTPQADGSVLVKVGVEGRALLGAVGGGGRLDAPVRVQIKQGDTVLATRARRVAVALPSGSLQGTFAVVEEGLVVPPQYAESYEIEVALAGAPTAGRARR